MFLAGIRAEAPILAGTIPFGLIYGVSAVGAHVPANVVQGMSLIIFAGSAQFVVAQLLAASAPALIIVLTGFVINLRHVLYSASIAPYLRRQAPGWRWLLAYLLTDEAYAVAILRFQRTDDDATHKHWYFLGAGLALWSTWQLATFAGVFLGAQIPAAWQLDFTLPLTFIALVVPALKDRALVVAASVAGLAAVLGAGLPYKLGLIVAAATGILAGLATEQFWPARPLASEERA